VLVELHAIEETFDDDEWSLFFAGPVNVEQLLRFTETWGNLYFGCPRWFAGETARIRNDVAFRLLIGMAIRSAIMPLAQKPMPKSTMVSSVRPRSARYDDCAQACPTGT